jgi:predicted HAD superfamily phosphohydrolase YqeG
VVGKPSPLMIDYIVYKYKIPKGKICMVGDRLDTDILFGKVTPTHWTLACEHREDRAMAASFWPLRSSNHADVSKLGSWPSC